MNLYCLAHKYNGLDKKKENPIPPTLHCRLCCRIYVNVVAQIINGTTPENYVNVVAQIINGTTPEKGSTQ